MAKLKPVDLATATHRAPVGVVKIYIFRTALGLYQARINSATAELIVGDADRDMLLWRLSEVLRNNKNFSQ